MAPNINLQMATPLRQGRKSRGPDAATRPGWPCRAGSTSGPMSVSCHGVPNDPRKRASDDDVAPARLSAVDGCRRYFLTCTVTIFGSVGASSVAAAWVPAT